jgi:hypothetical protein
VKSPHLRAADLCDELDELARMQPAHTRSAAVRKGWTAHVRRTIAQLRAVLIEADREVAEAFEDRSRRTFGGWKSSRTCAWCKGPMPGSARADASTCSKRCRQAKARKSRHPVFPPGIRSSSTRRTRRAEMLQGTRATDATAAGGNDGCDGTSSADWRSPERRAAREQLDIMAPPITPRGDGQRKSALQVALELADAELAPRRSRSAAQRRLEPEETTDGPRRKGG